MAKRKRGLVRIGGTWIPAEHRYRDPFPLRALRGVLRPTGLERVFFPPPGSDRVPDAGSSRTGGRWVSREERFNERGAIWRQVAARAWYLLIPFVGIGWAHDAYVRPEVEDYKSLRNQQRQETLDRIDDLRAEITQVQTKVVEVQAEIDTLFLPQIIVQQAQLDETIRLRMAHDRNPENLQAEIDSLKTMRDYLAADVGRVKSQLDGRQAILANLAVWNGDLQDSVSNLEHYLAVQTEELDRRERRRSLQDALGRIWYVLGPAIGIVWAHDS